MQKILYRLFTRFYDGEEYQNITFLVWLASPLNPQEIAYTCLLNDGWLHGESGMFEDFVNGDMKYYSMADVSVTSCKEANDLMVAYDLNSLTYALDNPTKCSIIHADIKE